jgi:hypothetical protein
MNFNILHALQNPAGKFEINRVVGAFGASAYVIGANAFVAWNMANGVAFDLTAYCLAFPAGLGVAVGSIAGAVALKDRGVAAAEATNAATRASEVQP